MPGVDVRLFFSFLHYFCFFFPVKKPFTIEMWHVFPFLVLKKLFGALNHLFQSIAFELAISGRFVKEKPRRLSLNRIGKEEP